MTQGLMRRLCQGTCVVTLARLSSSDVMRDEREGLAMSALRPGADIWASLQHVSFGPIAATATFGPHCACAKVLQFHATTSLRITFQRGCITSCPGEVSSWQHSRPAHPMPARCNTGTAPKRGRGLTTTKQLIGCLLV